MHTTVILRKNGEERLEASVDARGVAPILELIDECFAYPKVEKWIIEIAHGDFSGLDKIPDDGGPTLREELFDKLLWYGCRRSGMQELAKRGDVEVRVDVEGDTISNVKFVDHQITKLLQDLKENGLIRVIGERDGELVYATIPWKELTPEQRRLKIRMKNRAAEDDVWS